MNKGMYSSQTCEWETPQWLFDKLNAVHHFDLDVCASAENHKCEYYFDKTRDGLSREWVGTVWMNPPYGREIGKWVKKACEYALCGGGQGGVSASRTHRYRMVARLCNTAWESGVHTRTIEIRRKQRQRAVSVRDCGF